MDITNQIITLRRRLQEAISYHEFSVALRCIDEVTKLLEEQGRNLDQATRTELETMLVRFKWIAFVNIDDDSCLDLIEHHLIDAYLIDDYDFEEFLAKRVTLMQLEQLQVPFMEQVLEKLDRSTLEIGKVQLNVGGRSLPPTIGSWIKSYLEFPSASAYRDNLEELKFVNQSPDTKNLSQPERDLLTKLLKVYDGLRNAVEKYKSLPVTQDEKKAFADFNLYKWLPGLDYDEAAVKLAVNTPVTMRQEIAGGLGVAPVADNRRASPQSAPVTSIPPARPAPSLSRPTPSSLPTLPNNPGPNLPPVNLPQSRVNIQDILQKRTNSEDAAGLKIGGLFQENNLIKPTPPPAQPAGPSGTDIDKKLQELQKKISGRNNSQS